MDNEFGDLIQAFNRMVAALEEQRSGLNDTLSLLDSMLANAPIGLVFFDRQCRIVRVNQVFAEMTGVALSRHLGRTLPEVLPERIATRLEEAVRHVIEAEQPVHDLELDGKRSEQGAMWTWLVTAYPVRPTAEKVRWVGAIVMDVSERKRSEDALRRTEKLAATGRLAASIAHEINNPLEAITNLALPAAPVLRAGFCCIELRNDCGARGAPHVGDHTADSAFLPAIDAAGAGLNGGIAGRRAGHVQRAARDAGYYAGAELRSESRCVLLCGGDSAGDFEPGEQCDGRNGGRGRLIVRARRSRDWVHPQRDGVRITIADTGSGMTGEVRSRLFEAFFTTKGATGTGLGLWVSHEIILKHHGIIHLRSRAASEGGSSGTVFQIFFPTTKNSRAGCWRGAGGGKGIRSLDSAVHGGRVPNLLPKRGTFGLGPGLVTMTAGPDGRQYKGHRTRMMRSRTGRHAGDSRMKNHGCSGYFPRWE